MAKQIEENIYVHNVLLTTKSTQEAIQLYQDAKLIFQDAKMNLRAFISNDPATHDVFQTEDKAHRTQLKVVGVRWDSTQDVIQIPTLPVPTTEPTKRSILKFIASHFDPLGLISPTLLPLKYFLQTVNREQQEWKSGLSPQAPAEYDRLLRT